MLGRSFASDLNLYLVPVTHQYFGGTWHADILALHRTYGSVVRIAPNEVSVVHPDLARTVYSYQHGTRKFFNATDPNEHAFLRRRVSAVYSMSYILSQDDKIQSVLDAALARFEHIVDTDGGLVSLSDWASFFAYDVVGKLCVDEPMGFIKEGKDADNFIQAIHDAFYWTGNMGHLPGQSFLLMNPLMNWLGERLGLRDAGFTAAFVKVSVEQVVKRMRTNPAGVKHQNDMLDYFLAMKDTNGQPVGMPEVMAEVGNLLAAGADTTSVAIKAVLGYILQDRSRYRRLQSELDEAASRNTHRSLPYSTVKDLPFLTACIKEGFPPAGGITFDGCFVPQSATISMNPLAQNRCQRLFGSDADTWLPERWILGDGSSEEEVKAMDRNLASFGHGSRVCVGRNLATVEVYKFVSQLLLRFDVELVEPNRPWKISSFWVADIENLFIQLKKRDHDTAARD
ncbi:cytochrome P450 [Aspergillus undulatus]|uniref:cytochrome P450 n=1 Tax=Aspergillus undulatus TaxID=1810928 RepID=UPI003CCE2E82